MDWDVGSVSQFVTTSHLALDHVRAFGKKFLISIPEFSDRTLGWFDHLNYPEAALASFLATLSLVWVFVILFSPLYNEFVRD
jgi:hypothetical protein